jgi:hypothetical protein
MNRFILEKPDAILSYEDTFPVLHRISTTLDNLPSADPSLRFMVDSLAHYTRRAQIADCKMQALTLQYANYVVGYVERATGIPLHRKLRGSSLHIIGSDLLSLVFAFTDVDCLKKIIYVSKSFNIGVMMSLWKRVNVILKQEQIVIQSAHSSEIVLSLHSRGWRYTSTLSFHVNSELADWNVLELVNKFEEIHSLSFVRFFVTSSQEDPWIDVLETVLRFHAKTLKRMTLEFHEKLGGDECRRRIAAAISMLKLDYFFLSLPVISSGFVECLLHMLDNSLKMLKLHLFDNDRVDFFKLEKFELQEFDMVGGCIHEDQIQPFLKVAASLTSNRIFEDVPWSYISQFKTVFSEADDT